MRIPVALQLYSVKEETAKDFVGTLEQIAQIGYDGVEFAGYGDIPAQDMKELLIRLGLRAAGSHVPMERLRDHLQQEIDYNLEIGNKNIVCPWHKATTKEEYMELCSFLNQTGEALKRHGMNLYYHNHGHEFDVVDDVCGLDLIWNETDAELVSSELDLYWVKYAGVQPLDYLKSLAGRVSLLHCKDMDKANRNRTIEFGEGEIDFAQILEFVKSGNAGHVDWLIIEQEHFDRPYMESIKIGYENMKKMMDEVWK